MFRTMWILTTSGSTREGQTICPECRKVVKAEKAAREAEKAAKLEAQREEAEMLEKSARLEREEAASALVDVANEEMQDLEN